MKKKKVKKYLRFTLFSLLVFLSYFLIFRAFQSDILRLHHVHISYTNRCPYSDAQIFSFTQLPNELNQINLFKLNLLDIQKNLQKQDWIYSVNLEKNFVKNSLWVLIECRYPTAIYQNADQTLAYIDLHGIIFGKFGQITLENPLTLISGIQMQEHAQLQEVINFITTWREPCSQRKIELLEMNWNPSNGYRLLVSYLYSGMTTRVVIELGPEIQGRNDYLEKALQTIEFLVGKGISLKTLSFGGSYKVIVKR